MLLALGLAFLMVVVGLRLSAAELVAAFRQPRALALGLVVQMVALPLLALLLTRVFALPPPLALGLMLVAAAPGGVTSNYVALLAGADLALSTAMTLVTSLLAPVSLPVVLALSGTLPDVASLDLTAAMLRLALGMTLVAALPLALGMALRHWQPPWLSRRRGGLERLARLVFAAIVLTTFWQNRDAMIDHLGRLGGAALLLNLGAVAAGMALRFFGLSPAQSLAAAIECGLQNAAIAIFVAATVLGTPALAVPALIYAVIMNLTALALVAWGRRRAAATPAVTG